MAENLVDGEFWLPLQFLSDDEDGGELTTLSFLSKEKPSQLLNNGEDIHPFPSEFPYGFASSDFSSSVDSPSGSSETESDEDEKHMAELTHRMARSTLQGNSKTSDNNLGPFVSGSPQSTLCAFGSGCRCRNVSSSSHGSPNSACEVSSSKATWDLLHAAAGEVERMRLNQQQYNSQKLSPITLSSKNNTVSTNHEMGYFTQHSLSHQRLQIAQFQMLRQQQMAKQNSMWGGVQNQYGGVFENQQPNHTAHNKGRNIGDTNGVDGMRNTSTGALGLSSSAWPTLQHAKQQQFYNQAKQQQINNQQFGSGMRAVFLGNGSGRRESAGTGVFLPRRVDCPAVSRKKPVCSTALVPARVAQALNLNLDEYVVGQPQQHLHLHRFNSISNVDNVAPPRHRGNYVHSHQKHINNNISRPQPAVSNEISLPKEWTY